MASSINADNGVVSGSAGLKYAADAPSTAITVAAGQRWVML